MKPDIFKPYVLLRLMADAGMITIHGGDYSSNDLEFEVSGGEHYQSAYNKAFKLAIAAQIPLWSEVGELLYHPNIETMKDK